MGNILSSWQLLSARQRIWLAGWTFAILALGAVAAYKLGNHQREEAARSIRRHQERLGGAASKTEPARTPPAGHENDEPLTVQAGIYVDRIWGLNLAESTWSVDFFVWFSWRGDIDPGESFAVVDGEITTKNLVHKIDKDGLHYARYRVIATITKHFNASRFPLDDHMLAIALEDTKLQSYQLHFLPDTANSKISSRVEVTGYRVAGSRMAVRPHGYQSAMGDPTLPTDHRATYSQLVFAIDIVRPSAEIFTKLFLALYIAVGCSLLGLLLRSASEGLAISGTALFIEIVNAEVVAPLIPETGHPTLADMIGNVGYVTTGLVFLQGVISRRYYSDQADDATKRMSDWFDALSFIAIAALFVAVNLAVFLAA